MGSFLVTCFGGLAAVLALAVALRLLNGQIKTAGMFSSTEGGALEPERVQALIIALAIPVFYVVEAFPALRAGGAALSLPDVPDWMLTLTAGSQSLFIAGKIARQAARQS